LSDSIKIEQRSLFDSLDGLRVPKGQASLFPIVEEQAADKAASPAGPPLLEPSRENEWAGIDDLDELKRRILPCRACVLRSGAKGVVFGEGNPRAGIMFIGEGPGQTEDETGRPFVGRAGQLLDRALRFIGFSREDVFIANIVKCRPPNNRLPLPPEVEACLPHLKAQMRIIKPRVVVLLGALSSQTLINPAIRVTKDRGKWFTREGVEYLVTYHPAAVLRDEANKMKDFIGDMRSLREKWDKIQSGR